MFKFAITLIPLAVAFYTFLYGLDLWREKNHSGSMAVMALALTTLGFPLYLLFLVG